MSDLSSHVLPFHLPPRVLAVPPAPSLRLSVLVAAVVSGDDTVLLTPGRMSQRQVKERDKEREKEAGLQTPNREHIATPSSLSPGVSYTHGKMHTSIVLHRLLQGFTFLN